MHPSLLSISDFTYTLPDPKIARFPAPERDQSKLLVYRGGVLLEDHYSNLAQQLPKDSILFFNNSRVIPARLLFEKQTGAVIEIFCLEPHEQYADIPSALSTTENVLWKCLIGGASKWKTGIVLEKKFNDVILHASIVEKRKDCFIVRFAWEPSNHSFAELLQRTGAIPLPPYLQRAAVADDSVRYQTIYAKQEGSVAAPTAGLHFTPALLDSLRASGITFAELTLHVAAGTFLPVKTASLAGHAMHEEWISIHYDTIRLLVEHLPDPVIAVGTTSLRSLESLYWLAVRLIETPAVSMHELEIDQWFPYDRPDTDHSVKTVLENILQWMEEKKIGELSFRSRILIAPGYKFKIVKGLITNFHQPQSTLLLLVAALIGDNWKMLYDFALANNYRFLSYGDGCLLFS